MKKHSLSQLSAKCTDERHVFGEMLEEAKEKTINTFSNTLSPRETIACIQKVATIKYRQ